MTRGADTLQYKPTNNTKPRAADTQRVGAHRFRKLHGGTRKTFATMKFAINNLAALAALGLISFASAANAQTTIYSTFGVGDTYQSGGTYVASYPSRFGRQTQLLGAPFTSSSAFTLTSADIAFNADSRGANFDYVAEIQSDAGGVPSDTVLTSSPFTASSATPSLLNISFASTSLDADTPYWLVLRPASLTGNTQGIWAANDIGQGGDAYNGGGGWIFISLDYTPAFRINGTPAAAATPEPGSVALLVGMGVTGAGVLRRRRK